MTFATQVMRSHLLFYIEVIEMANDSDYGLACAIFTENVSRAIRVSNALEAGMVWVSRSFCFEKA